MATVNVPPAVTDHPALGEVNTKFARGAQQHPWLGLAAVAI
jgi:hypothetical protein